MTNKSNYSVLIYYHIPEYVDRYKELIKSARKDLNLLVCKDKAQIEELIGQAEIIFSGSSFPVETIPKAKNLKWIQSMAAGVENFTRSQLIPSGVILTKPKGIFGPLMAEYVLGYILAITQNIKLVFDNQKKKSWQPFVVESIRHKTVGIMGLGSVGAYVAYRLHLLGVEIIGLEEQEKNLPYVTREYTTKEIDAFLGESDFLVMALPLTDRTEGLLGEKQFDSMKKSAHLINISRGALIQDEALIDALRKDSIAGAVLDVFHEEPLPKNHPFWEMENVIITPHISAPSLPEDLVDIFLENLRRYEEGKDFIGIVDIRKGY